MPPTKENPEPKRVKEPDDSERDRFARFARKLVNVLKKEIEEKQREWETREGRPKHRGAKT
jgi:hypothetical protein